MTSRKYYPGKVGSPATTITANIAIGVTTIPVADVACFPDGPNIAVVGQGSDANTFLYTDMSESSGPGNLTGVSLLEGTAKAWGSGEVIARNFTAYDQDSLAPVQQYDFITLLAKDAIIPTTNPATLAQAETSTNKNNYMRGVFTVAGEGTENLQWLVDFPGDWDYADETLGIIQVNFIWAVPSGTDSVMWKLTGKLLTEGGTIDVAMADVAKKSSYVFTPGNVEISGPDSGVMTGDGRIALFKVTRVSPASYYSGEVDCTADAYLLGVRIKYIRTILSAPPSLGGGGVA